MRVSEEKTLSQMMTVKGNTLMRLTISALLLALLFSSTTNAQTADRLVREDGQIVWVQDFEDADSSSGSVESSLDSDSLNSSSRRGNRNSAFPGYNARQSQPRQFRTASNRRSVSQNNSPFSPRLARAPPMFGDSFAQGFQLLAFDGVAATADLALAGGSRRAKIAENSKAITEDRVFIMYNYFQNAIEADASDFFVGPDQRNFSVNRFTLGFEKTFLDNLFSVDVRLPVTDGYVFDTPNFAVAGGQAGNLAISLKTLFASDDYTSIVAGLTIDLPTGSDAIGSVNGVPYLLSNEAAHLAPFIGALHSPTPRVFQQLFVQLDVPVSDNTLQFFPPSAVDAGSIQDQELLYVDYSLGTWLFQNDDCNSRHSNPLALKNLAAALELHYTTTLNDADVLFRPTFITDFTFTNLANRQDVLNLTIGLHSQLNNGASVRVGGVFPLREDDDRFFDAEFQVQINMPL